ncbi:MAG: hypothetical protein QG564_844 [Campylobacterota bacterium]|nr:hypothetical protein [Campylobacterota bacterium]
MDVEIENPEAPAEASVRGIEEGLCSSSRRIYFIKKEDHEIRIYCYRK